MVESSSSMSKLPPELRSRLDELFGYIEHEFESLTIENRELRAMLEGRSKAKNALKASPEPSVDEGGTETAAKSVKKHQTSTKHHAAHKALYAKKLRSHTNKLRAQTTRLLRSSTLSVSCAAVHRFRGHHDGVWDLATSSTEHLATASADHVAMVWHVPTFTKVAEYTGHCGSVNSIRFHPQDQLLLSAGGEGEAHIWKLDQQRSVVSSEDELLEDGESCCVSRVERPLVHLKGHSGKVVIAADWMRDGDQVVTAGWDRLACLWDSESGHLIQQLAGHDGELTHIAAHAHCSLVVTCSKDSTFRLWDFRESIHSVSVFQGHEETVTSAVFTEQTNSVISGSDDKSVRIWDLRQMRTHVAMIRAEACVNRLAVQDRLLAIPLDNRQVRIYDIQSGLGASLPRRHGVGHARMVCAAAWSMSPLLPLASPVTEVGSHELEVEKQSGINLFTCGFDRLTIGWSVLPRGTE